jgi:hypothetical protein
MKEKDIQVLFARINRPSRSEVYELKITKSGRLPFSRLAKHQECSLLNAETTGLYHKNKRHERW